MDVHDEEIEESSDNEVVNISGEYSVTPWQVDGVVDYNKIVEDFGTRLITPEIIEKLKTVSGNIHPLLSRGFFFSHRDFDTILDAYRNGENFYLYTGRGPSGHVHMGHLMPWFFTKYLQDTFKSRLLFQITDDEKFLYSQHLSLQEVENYAFGSAPRAIARASKSDQGTRRYSSWSTRTLPPLHPEWHDSQPWLITISTL